MSVGALLVGCHGRASNGGAGVPEDYCAWLAGHQAGCTQGTPGCVAYACGNPMVVTGEPMSCGTDEVAGYAPIEAMYQTMEEGCPGATYADVGSCFIDIAGTSTGIWLVSCDWRDTGEFE